MKLIYTSKSKGEHGKFTAIGGSKDQVLLARRRWTISLWARFVFDDDTEIKEDGTIRSSGVTSIVELFPAMREFWLGETSKIEAIADDRKMHLKTYYIGYTAVAR